MTNRHPWDTIILATTVAHLEQSLPKRLDLVQSASKSPAQGTARPFRRETSPRDPGEMSIGDLHDAVLTFVRDQEAWAAPIVFFLPLGNRWLSSHCCCRQPPFCSASAGLSALAASSSGPYGVPPRLARHSGTGSPIGSVITTSMRLLGFGHCPDIPTCCREVRPSSGSGARWASSWVASSARSAQPFRWWPVSAQCQPCHSRLPMSPPPWSGRPVS